MKVSDDKTAVIGNPLDRIDGIAKVRGKAVYSAEWQIADLVYGYAIQSTIPAGKIKSIDDTAARKLSGVLDIFSSFNKPMLLTSAAKDQASHLFLLQENTVSYSGQIIAVVIAETLEIAKHAAVLVKIEYDKKPFNTSFSRNPNNKVPKKHHDYQRGDFSSAFNNAQVKFSATYSTPTETHNPMEPFATIAAWNGDNLTLYDSTQAVFSDKAHSKLHSDDATR